MPITSDEEVGARSPPERDEVIVTRVRRQPRLRRRVVDQLGLEANCGQQLLCVARLEIPRDLRPRGHPLEHQEAPLRQWLTALVLPFALATDPTTGRGGV